MTAPRQTPLRALSCMPSTAESGARSQSDIISPLCLKTDEAQRLLRLNVTSAFQQYSSKPDSGLTLGLG